MLIRGSGSSSLKLSRCSASECDEQLEAQLKSQESSDLSAFKDMGRVWAQQERAGKLDKSSLRPVGSAERRRRRRRWPQLAGLAEQVSCSSIPLAVYSLGVLVYLLGLGVSGK